VSAAVRPDTLATEVAVAWLLALVACGSPEGTACDPPGTQVPVARAAGCVAIDGGKLLLVQSTRGRWSIPGGYVEDGETSAAAAVRETWEEARVRVTAGDPVCAVPKNGYVAHRCAVTDAGKLHADYLETRAAKFMTRKQVEALMPTELRFPDQQASYLRMMDEAAQ
jgi:8-oxo-dGTP pyrophosphatase MutT (NUDIX family)